MPYLRRMKLIGLTGGIGTGKSTVARMLRERGWTVHSSDITAKEIMSTDPEVRREIADLLGPEVLTEGGLNKDLIAALVFGDSSEHKKRLQQLDQIVHPRVLDRHMEVIEEEKDKGTRIVVIESALLFEVGLEDGFDWVVVVDCPDGVRIPRVMERSGLSEDQVRSRMNEQLPMQEKRSLADFVIENAGSLEDLQRSVDKIATILEIMPDPEGE